MFKDEFLKRCDAANTGEEIVYHVGFLMTDRQAPARNFPEVDCLARAAWAAMEGGKVRLVQSKSVGAERYVYKAIKLPAPHAPVEWEGCYAVDTHSYTKPRARHRAPPLGPTMARRQTQGLAPSAEF